MTRLVGGLTQGGNQARVKLDWQAYFYGFLHTHGESVKYEGRLLFRDGWGYAPDNYQGPEYTPPKDERELRRLQTAYWTIYKKRLEDELLVVSRQIDTLRDWQESRSLPLQQRIMYVDRDSNNNPVAKIGPTEDMDLSGLQRKEGDLSYLIAEAKIELDGLH